MNFASLEGCYDNWLESCGFVVRASDSITQNDFRSTCNVNYVKESSDEPLTTDDECKFVSELYLIESNTIFVT